MATETETAATLDNRKVVPVYLATASESYQQRVQCGLGTGRASVIIKHTLISRLPGHVVVQTSLGGVKSWTLLPAPRGHTNDDNAPDEPQPGYCPRFRSCDHCRSRRATVAAIAEIAASVGKRQVQCFGRCGRMSGLVYSNIWPAHAHEDREELRAYALITVGMRRGYKGSRVQSINIPRLCNEPYVGVSPVKPGK